MMDLEFYAGEIAAKKKIINQVITLVNESEDTESILLAIKAIESLENVNLYPEFDVAVKTMVSKILSMNLTSSTGQDLTLLSRALTLKDIPMSNTDKWQELTKDEMNVDIEGDIVIGDRTLESYNDKKLEQFYIAL